MALSATSLEEVIKPEMQQRFRMEKKNHFEGLGTQLVTFTEGRVDEIAADVMLLTVNDICMSF
jgi:hypothetical protein